MKRWIRRVGIGVAKRSTASTGAHSGHYIQFERPDIVIKAVLSTIESVRASQPVAISPLR
jgi:hypothetical protein